MVPTPLRLRWHRGISATLLLLAASLAQAQGSTGRADAPRTRADPLDAQARVPALVYPSPLASYRRLGDDPPVPWTQANETVNRIGGWRAYARQAQQPEAAASAPRSSATSAPGAAPAHGGHKMH